ncbi:MAG TPA: hypothetical protein VHO90_00055, partial [Bacteroidales bacterium]|nr:hypothetical protein [Bacteroidales bacterium]
MKEVLEKLSFYNVFTYILTGVVYSFFTDAFGGLYIVRESWFAGIFLFYFVGLIIGETGRLIIEPMLYRLDIIKPLKEATMAKTFDGPGLQAMLGFKNMYRSVISLFVAIIATYLYFYIRSRSPLLNQYSILVIALLILILFV